MIMKVSDILSHRLVNQQIAETKFKKPAEVVGYMGAIQAQDYGMAKWAIGLRLPGSTDADIEKAFNDGLILRTHMLRPTWHFVCPKDIKWILELSAPRVHAFNALYYRKEGLDSKTLKRCNDLLGKTLEGCQELNRAEIKTVLEGAKIKTEGLRMALILMHAELDAVICSGAKKGKQFSYALLDEKAPGAKIYDKEEALAKLTKLYFTSRGPATVQDYAWWSGLTIKSAREGIATLGKQFARETIDGKEYIYKENRLTDISLLQKTFLMPDFDEYSISYKDRTALLNTKSYVAWNEEINITRQHILIIDGVRAGTWNKNAKNKKPAVDTVVFDTTKAKEAAAAKAVKKYLAFASE